MFSNLLLSCGGAGPSLDLAWRTQIATGSLAAAAAASAALAAPPPQHAGAASVGPTPRARRLRAVGATPAAVGSTPASPGGAGNRSPDRHL